MSNEKYMLPWYICVRCHGWDLYPGICGDCGGPLVPEKAFPADD